MEGDIEQEFLNEPNFDTVIQTAKELQGLIKHPGWKHIEKLLTKLSNVNRLKLDVQSILKPNTDPRKVSLMHAFISGEISTADKVSRMINTRIALGRQMEQRKLNSDSPADGGQGIQ